MKKRNPELWTLSGNSTKVWLKKLKRSNPSTWKSSWPTFSSWPPSLSLSRASCSIIANRVRKRNLFRVIMASGPISVTSLKSMRSTV